MNNLIRYYNQNRKKVWGIVIIIASVILLIQLVNYFVGENQKRAQNTTNIINTVSEFNTTNTGLTSTKSAVSGNAVSSSNLKTSSDLIGQFVTHCNNNDIEQAYNLLTDECKKQMYNSIQDFYNNYYIYIFENGNMSYTMENWTGNTYLVKFKKDLLSTGGKDDEETFSDYITIVRDGDEYKLNLNSYIGKTDINSTTVQNGISVLIESKETYMEYEIYNIKVKNDTEDDIILDTKNDTKSTYIKDSNGVSYLAFLNEIPDNDLYINSKYEKNLSIKFSNNYSSNRKIKNLIFANMEKQNDVKERITFYANV